MNNNVIALLSNETEKVSSSNDIQIFESSEFGSIRTIEKGDDVWFVASDVAKILEYSDATHMTRMLDDDEKALHLVESLKGGIQNTTIINESGLYHAVLSSKKTEAQSFRKWITSEVIPSIRKTGSYEAKPVVNPLDEEKLKVQKAELLMRLSDKYNDNALYSQSLDAEATKMITGRYVLPPPENKSDAKYTATDIAEKLGITKNKVGMIANKYNLKTAEYGEKVIVIDKQGSQRPNFIYNEKGLQKIKELLTA